MDDLLALVQPLFSRVERETDTRIKEVSERHSRRGFRNGGAFFDAALREFVKEVDQKTELLIQHRVSADQAVLVLDTFAHRGLDFVSRELQRMPWNGSGAAIDTRASWDREMKLAVTTGRSRVMLEANHQKPQLGSAAQRIEIRGNTGGDITVLANQNAGGTIQSPQQNVGRSAATLGQLVSVLAGPVMALWKLLARWAG